jgi:hypothetical protein
MLHGGEHGIQIICIDAPSPRIAKVRYQYFSDRHGKNVEHYKDLMWKKRHEKKSLSA